MFSDEEPAILSSVSSRLTLGTYYSMSEYHSLYDFVHNGCKCIE